MKNELTEILEQLRDLTARVESLLNNIEEQEALSESSEDSEDSDNSEISEPSEDIEISELSEPSSIPMPASIKFSLNDRFRFQRAIFGNSPERMANAMTAISAMTTADEVYAYLTNVLNRNVDDPDVEDFFREVTLRFSDHKPLIL